MSSPNVLAFHPSAGENVGEETFVIVWSERDTPTGEPRIYGHRVDDSGEPEEARVAISPSGVHAQHPALAFNESTEEWLVVWTEIDSFGGRRIVGQRLDTDLAAVGALVELVNAGFSPFGADVAYEASVEGFLLAWAALDGSTQTYQVYAQLLNATAGPEVGVVQLSEAGGFSNENARRPSVSFNSNDDLGLVSWAAYNSSNGIHYVKARQLSEGSLEGGILTLNSSSSGVLSHVTSSFNPVSNQVLVGWTSSGSTAGSGSSITVQGVDGGGNIQAPNTLVSGTEAPSNLDVATLGNGQHVAIWQANPSPTSGLSPGINVSLLTSSGSLTGATTSPSTGSPAVTPTAAALLSSAIGWTSAGLGTSGDLSAVVVQGYASAKRALVRALLGGAYDSAAGTMSTALAAAGLIPLDNPYGAERWGHDGGERVEKIESDVVDWVLVRLYSGDPETSLTQVASRAGFLKQDGTVTDIDGKSALAFRVEDGSYYVSVEHRNHLGVLSAQPTNLEAPIDFGATAAYGTAPTRTAGSVFTLWPGDADGSGSVDAKDALLWKDANATTGYSSADFTLSGTVDADDWLRVALIANGNVVSW
ncbi:MAG: hypothetical protein AAGI08_08745 [Bacteroidota bacterium]